MSRACGRRSRARPRRRSRAARRAPRRRAEPAGVVDPEPHAVGVGRSAGVGGHDAGEIGHVRQHRRSRSPAIEALSRGRVSTRVASASTPSRTSLVLRGGAGGLLGGQRHPLFRVAARLLRASAPARRTRSPWCADLGHERAEQVVDRPERVPVGGVSSSVSAVRKMIGVCALRLRCRISAAVSKPSISGMLTSSRITAKSWSSR